MKIDFLSLKNLFPTDKIIKEISKALGRISKAYFDKKDIDTRTYEIKKIAEARAEEFNLLATAVQKSTPAATVIEYSGDSVKIKFSPQPAIQMEPVVSTPSSLAERTQRRMQFQENKKQLNIESVTAHAAENLIDEKTITSEPLDEDWMASFFRIAGDISNEKMQAIWGKVLAGELKTPGSFSLRTLQLLQCLSQEEAEIFKKFAAFAINASGTAFILNFDNEDLLTNKYTLSYHERLILEDVGILASHDLRFTMPATGLEKTQCVFLLGDKVVISESDAGLPEHNLKVLGFTKVGRELITLVRTTPNEDYIRLLAAKIKRNGVTVKHGNVVENNRHGIQYQELGEIPSVDYNDRHKLY